MNPILLKIIFFLSGVLVFFIGYVLGGIRARIKMTKKGMNDLLEMFSGLPKIMEKKE